jgi:hypothetical protein
MPLPHLTPIPLALLMAAAPALAQVPGAPAGGGYDRGVQQRGADSAMAPLMGVGLDPIGAILEVSDSLHLADSVKQRLVQLNLRLFRRNRQVQMRLDSMMPRQSAAPGRSPQRPPPEVMERAAPLIAQLREQSAAARDTALAMLSEQQRARLDTLQARRAQGGQRRRG